MINRHRFVMFASVHTLCLTVKCILCSYTLICINFARPGEPSAGQGGAHQHGGGDVDG